VTVPIRVAVASLTLAACGDRAPAAAPAAPSPFPSAAPAVSSEAVVVDGTKGAEPAAAPLVAASPKASCAPADWSPRALSPLLAPGKTPTSAQPDRPGAAELAFSRECTDAPNGPSSAPADARVIDGVEIRLLSAVPAGTSGRGWAGNQCSFEVRLADGAGIPTRLGAKEIPPFNTVNAVARAGSAAYFSVAFNGYSAEFPKGGNHVVAVDLCAGRVVWQSASSTSNTGLLLLDDYLIAPYGFTRERRYVFVFDARSGSVIQKLGVIENICPSKSWAPNFKPGDRCDAPGQTVGAATMPRVEGGLFLVDTNTGSASFQFR
jgi:hypothetical protein